MSKNRNRNEVEQNAVEVEEPVVAEDTAAEPAGTLAEAIEENVQEVKKEQKIGVVSNCVRLRVRKQPAPDGKVLCEIDVNSEVLIDDEASTEDFYKVCTESGAEGYCMKQFISIKA